MNKVSFNFDSIQTPSPSQEEEKQLEKLKSHFLKQLEEEQYGFYKVDQHKDSVVKQCQEIHAQLSHKKYFVHVGIGGSALGPELLINSLNKSEIQFVFINNIDPDQLHSQLRSIDIKESLFYFVSKSGTTAETMANFAITCTLLEENNIPSSEYKNYFVFATDPEKGVLREIANEYQISCLSVPQNIGGRYSVLTPVGLFPALFANIEISKLFAGFSTMKRNLEQLPAHENPLYLTGHFLNQLKNQQYTQTVLMPYSSKLRNLSDWFVQLWAESLGKELDKNGKTVETGLTPIAAYGATDQHSQVQLFMEGPRDKVFFIIEIENFSHDFSLSNKFDYTSLKNLAPFSLAQLMKAELEGTIKAFQDKERPLILIKLESLGEESLAEIITFFECLTVLMGDFLGIDPLNQPGVEAGKRYAHKWLQNNN